MGKCDIYMHNYVAKMESMYMWGGLNYSKASQEKNIPFFNMYTYTRKTSKLSEVLIFIMSLWASFNWFNYVGSCTTAWPL